MVYECTDNTTGDVVAVKLLKPETCADIDVMGRFRQEVSLIERLSHHNTIRVLDTGQTDSGLMYMVLEFAYGVTLDELVDREGRLSPERIVNIVEQVLGSLSEAHAKGIVHRDLKPENIMIGHRKGADDFVKVLDFGIGKALQPDQQQVFTRTGMVFCTPRYAAPEILTGRGISPASDVYSMGLLAIELLGGRPVFSAQADAALVAFQISKTPVPIPPEISGTPLGRVIRQATAKDPKKRYGNASEMLEALQALGPQSALTNTPPARRASEQRREAPSSDAKTMMFDANEFPTPAAPPSTEKSSEAKTMMFGSADFPSMPGSENEGAGEGASEGKTMAFNSADFAALVEDQASPPPREGAASAEPMFVPPYDVDHAARTQMRPSASLPALGDVQSVPKTRATGAPGKKGPLVALLLLLLLAGGLAGGLFVFFDRTQGGASTPEPAAETDSTAPGTGPDGAVALLPTEIDPAMVEETSARDLLESRIAAQSWQAGGWLGELPVEPEVDTDVNEAPRPARTLVGESEQAMRLALLYESAQASEEALALLEGAARSGSLGDDPDRLPNDLGRLTEGLVDALLELGQCDAAAGRLSRSRSRARELNVANSLEPRFATLDDRVGACQAASADAASGWSARTYRTHLTEGDAQCASAESVPPGSGGPDDARRNALYRCVHHRQSAIGLLRGALERGDLPGEQRASARQELLHLNEQVTATLLNLDMTVAAEVQLTSTLSNEELLPADSTSALRTLAEALRNEVLEPLQRAFGGALPDAPDWDRYDQLAARSDDLLVEAKAIEIPDPEPQGFTSTVRITSNPNGARVYRERELLGRTPYDGEITSMEPQVTLTLRKTDHETARVVLDLSQGPELSRSVRLESETRHPFGHTERIGD